MNPKAAGATPAVRERILLVDDEEMVRMMIKSVLGFRGYQVTEAGDGIEALEKFKAASPPIDLVLMDYHLPRLNGQETLVQIRELDPKVPAVILSGGLHDGIGEEGTRGLEGVGFLHKPFQNDELFRIIRELLDARES